jgi:sulfur relay (sulfurtransferase) DsrC/TusE family protein
MKNKEKYINFIVDDLVKKTEISNNRREIKYPFIKIPISFDTSPSIRLLKEYIEQKYGVHEKEMDTIISLYLRRIPLNEETISHYLWRKYLKK